MSSNRVVAITGASAGIGRVTALRLARDGWALAVNARRGDRLEQLAVEIVAAGGQALPVVGDVTKESDMQMLVERAIARFGHLDVMLCNAGFGMSGTVDTIAADAMRRLIDVNYLGTYYAARAAMPSFRRQGRGHLIIVSSIVGKRGVPFMGPYAATKFAQVGLAECLRSEFAGSDIHVSVVFPISTATDFHQTMARESGSDARTFGPRQSAAQVADAIARAIARPVPEVYPYWPSRGLVWLNAVAPGFTDRVVKRFGRQPVT
jgi:short-subunit dehydrogenase